MFRTGAHFTILVLVIGLVLLREARQEPMRQFDESFADFLARNSHRTEDPAPVTLIEVNANSLKDHPWPWTPLDFALFFQAANNFQPEVLATDEILRWDERETKIDTRTKLPQYKKNPPRTSPPRPQSPARRATRLSGRSRPDSAVGRGAPDPQRAWGREGNRGIHDGHVPSRG